MNDTPSQDQDDAMNAVMLKAMTDADFRTQLLEDPRGTLQQENVDIPPEITVKVMEMSPEEMLLPLPPFIGDQAALSDSELDAISGGIDRIFCPIINFLYGPGSCTNRMRE